MPSLFFELVDIIFPSFNWIIEVTSDICPINEHFYSYGGKEFQIYIFLFSEHEAIFPSSKEIILLIKELCAMKIISWITFFEGISYCQIDILLSSEQEAKRELFNSQIQLILFKCPVHDKSKLNVFFSKIFISLSWEHVAKFPFFSFNKNTIQSSFLVNFVFIFIFW